MANLVYIEPGTTLTINGEGDADYAWSMESLANSARIRVLRRGIARMNTILHERATGVRGQESR